MYVVTLDGNVLYDPEIEGLEIYQPKVELEVNKTGAFDFKIYPTHPFYTKIKKLKSVIEVYQRGYLVFRGRPLNDAVDFDKGKVIQCEGDLAFLNDSIQRPYEYSGGVKEYLEFLISRHNSQVEEDKKFVVGNVTVTDPNDYIVRADSQYQSTWQLVEAKLVKYLGGYIILRRSEGVNYIDYLADSKYRSDQIIELGKNMLDLNTSIRGEAICTALIPTGATIEETEDEPESVVDITSVNDGIDYVFDQEAVNRFGWIFKHVEYEDITLPENLKKRAEKELREMVKFHENIEIKALDQNMVSEDFHRFRFFEYVKVISKPHNLDEFYLIKSQTLHLDSPEQNTIVIGAERTTISDNQSNLAEELNVIRDESIKHNHKINETYKNLQLIINQSAESYRREVIEQVSNELEQMRSETSTMFEQNKDEFIFQFSTMLEQLEQMDSDTTNQFNELTKYIRFVDGTIIIGEVGNEIQLRLLNDRIQFLQDNMEVAYFTNNKLYVIDGEFTNTLTLGKFAFFPMPNGNLSFRKVRD